MRLIEKYIKRCISILFMFCICVFAFPQRFNRLTEDQGLSSRRCYAVCQDKNGLIWIATKLSIDRYDGHEIIHYELLSPDRQTTGDIDAKFVCLSPDSLVWAFTQSGYIYRYDEHFDAFVFVYSIRDFYQSGNVILNSLFFEDKNTLLLATRKGVLKLDLARKIASTCKILDETEVYYIDKEGEFYYFATKNGLQIIRYFNNNAIIVNHLLAGYTINRIYYDAEYKQFWIGTFSKGIFVLQDDDKGKLLSVQQKINKPVRAILPYNETQLAVGIDGEGVFLINRQTFEAEQTLVWAEDQPQSIGSNSVWDLFIDKQKIMWVATYHRGISYSDCSNLNFRSIVHEKQNINSITSNYINAVIEDKDGDLWFGTNNGLSRLNRSAGRWQHFFNNEVASDKNVILTLCESADGRIWAGGYAFGMAFIDKHTGTVKRFHTTDAKPVIGTDYVYSIYEDKYTGNLWIGGIYGKISCYNPHTNQSQLYNEESLRCFCNYNDSVILLGLNTGLYLMNKNTGEKQSTRLLMPISDIRRDDGNSYWIGTMNNGLYHYDMKADSLSCFTKRDNELSSDHVYAIQKDESGYLWISTEMGLNRMNPQDGKITNFDKQDGLISNLFIPNASIRCRSNEMIFGSADGAVAFYPSEIQKIKQQNYYRLIFTGFYLFGDLVTSGENDSPLKNPVNKTSKIVLSYNKNYFSFHFSLPNYYLSDKTQYSHFLKGYDLDWSHSSTNQFVSYSKIQPGHYTFMVRAYSEKQLLEERHIEIIVRQPWWNTVWAWITYLMAAFLLIFYLIDYYSKQMKKKQTREKMEFFLSNARRGEKTDTRLFVVVSDTGVASYFIDLLSPDYCVDIYNTGSEALNSATRIQPQLILIDFQLTDMDGFSLCKKIKKNSNTAHIPVLLITNHTYKKVLKKIFASGATDFISKPFESEIISMQIANLLSLQQGWQNKTLTDMKKNNLLAVDNERDQEFMNNFIKLIEQNLDNPNLNLSMVCRELALSRTLLYNWTTRLTGHSANEFIRVIRLKNAANMLISGQYTITEVASKVGFDNPKYFSKIFKNYYKVAPKNYMNKL